MESVNHEVVINDGLDISDNENDLTNILPNTEHSNISVHEAFTNNDIDNIDVTAHNVSADDDAIEAVSNSDEDDTDVCVYQ